MRYFDSLVFTEFVQPQYKNFCGVCSVIAVVNSRFNSGFTQDSIHAKYKAGYYTKRKVAADSLPQKDQLEIVDLKGMSNFDIIRLYNSVAIDNDVKPYSALLTGENFARFNPVDISNWLSKEGNFAIFHKVNHYVTIAGFVFSDTGNYWIIADSKRKGDIKPVTTIEHGEIQRLSETSEKYGFILLSDKKIDFLSEEMGNDEIFPIESTNALTVE